MQLQYVCGHCNNRFVGTDDIPGRNEQVCPRCNWGTYAWIPSSLDRALGRPYVYFMTRKEARLGREDRQLRAEGLWRYDFGTKELERGELYVPCFRLEPEFHAEGQ